MPNRRLTLACRNYEGTNAILRGLIKMPGVDLEVIEMSNLAGMFGDMFKAKLDIFEMSLAKLIYYTSRQGVSQRKLSSKELFAPSTWNLTE